MFMNVYVYEMWTNVYDMCIFYKCMSGHIKAQNKAEKNTQLKQWSFLIGGGVGDYKMGNFYAII